MIAEYESEGRNPELDSPRQYGLTLTHKHLPEMTKVCNLTHSPVFNPIVADFYSGMCVTVPIHTRLANKELKLKDFQEFFADYYKGANFLSVSFDEGNFLAANTFSGTNNMSLYVGGKDEQILLCARFDNLGKGASGAAVQNMNIALGLDETAYLK